MLSNIPIYNFHDFVRFFSIVGLYLFFRLYSNNIVVDSAVKNAFICAGLYTLTIGIGQFIKSGTNIIGSNNSVTGFSFLIVLMTIIIFQKLSCWKGHMKPIILCIIVLTALLILTWASSRTGCIAICIAAIIILEKKIIAIVMIGGIIIILLFPLYKIDSTKGRAFIYQTSISMFDTPRTILWGRGRDAFRKEYMLYQARALKNKPGNMKQLADNIKHPLNEFILAVIDYGTIRLIPILAITLTIIYIARHNCLHLSILSTVLVFSFFSYPLKYPATWIALLWSIACLNKTNKISNTTFMLPLTTLILGFIIFASTYDQIKTHNAWERAYSTFCLGNTNEAMKQYNTLHNKLFNQPEFLYNYSSILLIMGNEKDALNIVQKCSVVDYDTELLRGDIYTQKKDYKNALQHYQLAADMCPNRFIPLYAMFNIYEAQSDKQNRKIIANNILRKTIKVHSYEIEEIREYVKQKMKNEK